MTEKLDQLFPIVPAEEIAFAMSIFVSAANMRIPLAQAMPRAGSLLSSSMSGPGADEGLQPLDRRRRSEESTLDYAFGVLWHEYEGHYGRASICARVLAFHSLMTRSSAGFLDSWLRPCPDSPEAVILDPAVVQAVASVALAEGGRLSESLFVATVRALAQIGPSD